MKRREFVVKTGIAVAGISMAEATMRYPSKNDQITIGIIGTGSRGGGLIPFINAIEGMRVAACCDVLPFRLQEGMAVAGISMAKAYKEYKALLENKDIDAVLIATPFSTHDEIALDALDAGKHVYCEKTMAKGYAPLKKVVTKAGQSKNIFQTGHQYHSSRLYTHIVDLIKNGKVGNITAFECQWNRNGNWRRPVPSPEYERAINWRMYKEYSGGLLAELCSHQLDFVNWVLDAVPEKVVGDGGIDYWKDGRETYDNVHMIYSYPNGIRAKFTCLTSNSKDDYQIKVLGDKGAITIGYTQAWFHPEKEAEDKEVGEVDGVSGATIKWEQGKGIPIEVEHLHPSEQALLDFQGNVMNNTMPKSNVLTGAKAAICVQMGLDALYEQRIVNWQEGIL